MTERAREKERERPREESKRKREKKEGTNQQKRVREGRREENICLFNKCEVTGAVRRSCVYARSESRGRKRDKE